MRGTIAFDFDGVIHKYSNGWQDGSIYDGVNADVIITMHKLMEDGYAVIILSTRDPKQICDWWNNATLPMKATIIRDDIKFWNDTSFVGVTNRKLPALVYVDDRGVTFEGNTANDLYDRITTFRTYQEKKNKLF